MNFTSLLKKSFSENRISDSAYETLGQLYSSYIIATKDDSVSLKKAEEIFIRFLELMEQDHRSPFLFQPFHQKILHPFDHRTFGIEFLKPVVKSTTVLYPEVISEALENIALGANIIFLANHQTEVDPHLTTIALSEAGFPHFTDNMIFVAGDRVTRDPLAKPLSMGYDLLCIYSKRHIEHPKELKNEKLRHNYKALHILKKLLQKGSQCIYVAPSGGRDRPDENGKIKPAAFDAASIEVFRVLAKHAKTKTFFIPLALKTFDILPPPPTITQPIGEIRNIFKTDIFFAFGHPVDMSNNPDEDKLEQKETRKNRLFKEVLKLYEEIDQL